MHLSLLEPLGAHAPLPVIARRPAQLVGNTPILWIDEPFAPPGRGFYAKLEGANPGGIKDRPGLHMVAEARRRGGAPTAAASGTAP